MNGSGFIKLGLHFHRADANPQSSKAGQDWQSLIPWLWLSGRYSARLESRDLEARSSFNFAHCRSSLWIGSILITSHARCKMQDSREDVDPLQFFLIHPRLLKSITVQLLTVDCVPQFLQDGSRAESLLTMESGVCSPDSYLDLTSQPLETNGDGLSSKLLPIRAVR